MRVNDLGPRGQRRCRTCRGRQRTSWVQQAPGEVCATTNRSAAEHPLGRKDCSWPRSHRSISGRAQFDDRYLARPGEAGQPRRLRPPGPPLLPFVRLKASSYFLDGGDPDDLIQEGLVGLYKAIRDYRSDRESSFRNFAELCITRQIITAVKTATRNKHTPLNDYVSFSATPAGAADGEPTLDEVLPGPTRHDPVNQVISSEELRSLVACLSTVLSELESRVLSLYLDGHSYTEIGERIGCDCKTVDNALQRVKRKVGAHLQTRRSCCNLGRRARAG